MNFPHPDIHLTLDTRTKAGDFDDKLYVDNIEYLKNKEFSNEILDKAKESLFKDFAPISDMRASREYRIEIAKNLLAKCFDEIKNKKNLRLIN